MVQFHYKGWIVWIKFGCFIYIEVWSNTYTLESRPTLSYIETRPNPYTLSLCLLVQKLHMMVSNKIKKVVWWFNSPTMKILYLYIYIELTVSKALGLRVSRMEHSRMYLV